TDEMRHAITNAIDERNFCLVVTASAEGWPTVSFRGSVAIYSDDELSFWNRTRRETVPNIDENPRVQVFYRNRATREVWRFIGMARNVTDTTERERIMEITDPREMAADPDRKGVGSILKVQKILDRTGEAIQEA